MRINDLRRRAVKKLINNIIKSTKEIIVNDYERNNMNSNNKSSMNCFVKTEEQLLACLNSNISNIYVEEELYNKYKDKYNNLVLYLPRINKKYKEYSNEKLIIRELGALKYSNENKIITDYTLNVTNSYSIDFLNKYNVERITLSTEIGDENIKNLINNTNSSNLELIIYGNFEIFITKYCILNKNNNCSLCKTNNKYYLVDRKNEKYQIFNDKLCNNILLSSKKINLINKIYFYKNIGINHFRLQFYNETYDEIKKLLKTIDLNN